MKVNTNNQWGVFKNALLKIQLISIKRQEARYLLAVSLIALIFSGCGAVATRISFYKPITEELKSGQFNKAIASFDQARKKGKFDNKDRFVYLIDSGLLNYYATNYDSSNQKLNLAESTAEDLYTKSLSRAAASMVLNDNILEYAGEDYEILYTNLIKALNYVSLNKFEDAFVEIKRANLKLELLDQKYGEDSTEIQKYAENETPGAQIDYSALKIRFSNDAFARYLSMHLYAADGKYDDAAIDMNLLMKAFETQPNVYNFNIPDANYSSPDGAILSVIGLAGLAPTKEALNLRIRTDKQLGLVQILYTDPWRNDSEYGHLILPVKEDYYFKFAIPQLVERPSVIKTIKVYADSNCIGELQLIEDVGKLAIETFEIKKTMIYLRSVIRSVVKGLAANKLKKKADTGGLEGWLKKAAIDVGTDISENADLRCSRFLPGRIFIGDFDLMPGTYNLSIEFLDEYDVIVKRQAFSGLSG